MNMSLRVSGIGFQRVDMDILLLLHACGSGKTEGLGVLAFIFLAWRVYRVCFLCLCCFSFLALLLGKECLIPGLATGF